MNTVRYLFALSVLVNFNSVMTMEESNKESKSVKESAEELADLIDAEKMVPFIENELWLAGISLISPEPKQGNYKIEAKKKIEEMLGSIRGELFFEGKSTNFSYIAEEHLNNAARGLARYHIRMVQDEACCYYESDRAKRMEENLEFQDFVQAIKRYMSKEKLNTLYLEQIVLAQQMTLERELPAPDWILKFSGFDEKMKLIPWARWTEERIKALEYFKQKIESRE